MTNEPNGEVNSQKLTKKELNKIWFNWFHYHLTVFGYERLQAPGFLLSMLPIFEKYYKDDPEKMKAALNRHTVFYNTNAEFGAIVPGIVASLEETKAQGGDISDDFINSMKVGLMGPIAGIGDSITQATLPPIVLSIAIGLAANGSVLGAIFAVVALVVVKLIISRFLFMQGYKTGQTAVHSLLGEKMARLQEAMSVLGLTVIGAITASYINFNIVATYKSEFSEVNFQEILDGIFPKLIPMLLVLLGYFLLKKKKFSAIKLMGVYFVIAVVCSLIGLI